MKDSLQHFLLLPSKIHLDYNFIMHRLAKKSPALSKANSINDNNRPHKFNSLAQ